VLSRDRETRERQETKKVEDEHGGKKLNEDEEDAEEAAMTSSRERATGERVATKTRSDHEEATYGGDA